MISDRVPGTLAERLRQQIADAIFTGAFPPGAHLDDKVLSQKYETSRTPVREALNQLAGQGLVHAHPRVGMTVAQLDPRERISMLELTAELEGVAARLAARRMSAEARQQLQAIQLANQAHVDARDVDAYRKGNAAFHDAIYAGCANDLLVRHIRDLRRRLLMYRKDDVFSNPQRPGESHGEHGRICNAVLNGDGEEAQAAAVNHITSGGMRFVDMLMTSR
ncbi:MAG TPA: GntR family transcriptional regulator [Burkholderiaceae bacterium]|nr:GntR family transcriptional regulator [Burkholderiaceae bacterium]